MFQEKNLLNIHLYTYQAGKWTELVVSNFVVKLNHSLENLTIAVAPFLEIKGAFNNALPISLYGKTMIREMEKIICWITAKL